MSEGLPRLQRRYLVTGDLVLQTAMHIGGGEAALGATNSPVLRRAGVAIDRDSERAMDGLLYDYEVVPPTMRFGFELLLDNPDDTELGLACLGIAELLNGYFSIGGKRSSGLGRCRLETPRIYAL